MQTVFSVLLSLTGLSALFVGFVRSRCMVRQGADAGFVFAAVLFVVGTNAASFFLPGQASIPLAVIIVAFAAFGAWRMRLPDVFGGRDPSRRRAWYLYGLIVTWCLIVDMVSEGGIYGNRLFTYCAALVSWLAVGCVMARTEVSARLMAYVGLLLLGLMTAPTAVVGEAFWRDCTVGELEKCSIADSLFKSYPASENYIAIQASFVLALAVVGLRARERVWVALFCLLIVVSTGSRTAYIALGVGLVWLLVSQTFTYLLDQRRAVDRLPLPACLFVAAACVGIPLYLMATATVSSFSRRGAIWLVVDDYIEGSELVGVGVSKWDFLRTLGGTPQHFFHSTYILTVFAGGLIALMIFALWIVAVLRGEVFAGHASFVKLPVVVVVTYCITEVAWNPLAVDGFTWIAFTCMLLVSAKGSRDVEGDDIQSDARSLHSSR